MTSLIRLSLALVLLLCGTGYAAPISLVTNGSFEQGALGIGSFQGWQTTFGDSATFVDSNGQTGLSYGQASEGKWAAYFGSTSASGGAFITQSLLTAVGQSYNLGFDIANDDAGLDASNGFVVYIAGVPVFSAANLPDQGFTHQQISFLATSTSTALRFSAFNDQSYVELDNVSVQSAVPEPSSIMLLATGMFASGGLAWVLRLRSGSPVGAFSVGK